MNLCIAFIYRLYQALSGLQSLLPRQTIDFCHSTSCTSKQGHTVDIWDIRQRQQQLVDQLNSLRQPPKEHCKGCLVHRDLQPTRRHPLAYWQYRSTVYSLVPITARWTGSLREGKTSITRCHWWGSNPRPLARQPNALTARPPTLYVSMDLLTENFHRQSSSPN